jgi:hypothetical protein
MFSTGLLLSAGATVVVVLVDKALEDAGYYWVGTILKIALPLAGMALGIYFLEHNPILRWLK